MGILDQRMRILGGDAGGSGRIPLVHEALWLGADSRIPDENVVCMVMGRRISKRGLLAKNGCRVGEGGVRTGASVECTWLTHQCFDKWCVIPAYAPYIECVWRL